MGFSLPEPLWTSFDPRPACLMAAAAIRAGNLARAAAEVERATYTWLKGDCDCLGLLEQLGERPSIRQLARALFDAGCLNPEEYETVCSIIDWSKRFKNRSRLWTFNRFAWPALGVGLPITAMKTALLFLECYIDASPFQPFQLQGGAA